MDYSAGYVPYLLKAMHAIRQDIGTTPMFVDRTQYMITLEMLALVSMVMKVVQDLAPLVATDSLWTDRLGIAIDTGPSGARAWPGWVVLQVPPEKLALYGATEADSPAVLQAKITAYNQGG